MSQLQDLIDEQKQDSYSFYQNRQEIVPSKRAFPELTPQQLRNKLIIMLRTPELNIKIKDIAKIFKLKENTVKIILMNERENVS